MDITVLVFICKSVNGDGSTHFFLFDSNTLLEASILAPFKVLFFLLTINWI